MQRKALGVVINLANHNEGSTLLVQEGVCKHVVAALSLPAFTQIREVRIYVRIRVRVSVRIRVSMRIRVRIRVTVRVRVCKQVVAALRFFNPKYIPLDGGADAASGIVVYLQYCVGRGCPTVTQGRWRGGLGLGRTFQVRLAGTVG